ncbi:hypothetical protein NIES4103_40230 [Nostoc sp. NIES-4103]|nr:hypothetical protein NIES4103_40230 [Nostoc sp. NIES-4103]
MQNQYLLDLINFSIGASVASAIFLFFKINKGINYDYDLDNNFIVSLLTFLFVMVLTIASSFTVLLFIHPIINLFKQSFLDFQFYRQELITGILVLRINSILFGYKALILITKFDKDTDDFLANFSTYSDLEQISDVINIDTIRGILLTQSVIYTSITFFLWYLILFFQASLETRLVSWGLFFIADDWNIIADNFVALKGRIFELHKWRIIIFNIFLVFTILIACFKNLPIVVTGISVLYFGFLVFVNSISWFIKD